MEKRDVDLRKGGHLRVPYSATRREQKHDCVCGCTYISIKMGSGELHLVELVKPLR